MSIGQKPARGAPSKLGSLVRERRLELDLGVRALARLIHRSPGFISQLELNSEAPSLSEETLATLSEMLELDADSMFVLAQRLPEKLMPSSPIELAIVRQIKGMSSREQEALLKRLQTSGK